MFWTALPSMSDSIEVRVYGTSMSAGTGLNTDAGFRFSKL